MRHRDTAGARPLRGPAGSARLAPRRRRPWPAPRVRRRAADARHFAVVRRARACWSTLCFVLAPIAISFGYSLTNYNPFNPPTSTSGCATTGCCCTDEEFLTSLRVTTILTLIVVIVPNVLGLAVALLLDRRGWLYNALRSVFFTPVVLSSVVVSIIWTRLLDDDGPLNRRCAALGVDHPPGWLSDPDYALYSLGVDHLLADARLLRRGLPRRAAGRPGGAARGRGRSTAPAPVQPVPQVTWPLLAPALTINTVVLLISAFKVYDHIQVITNGGPGTGTTATIAFNVLQTGFDANRVGYASAMAVVMLVIVARRLGRRAASSCRRREVDL